jgi:hypothetical protein
MSEQTPGDASSAFKARLDALRSKGPPPAAPAPSLKERLQQGAPPMGPSSPEDLKARIQSRFQKKPEAPSSFSRANTPSSPVDSPSVAPVQFEETGDLPGSREARKKKKTDLWSLEQGGRLSFLSDV